jgi:hypothetical protein
MKLIFAAGGFVLAIACWDASYNHGTWMRRTDFMLRDIIHNFR